jgi:hypothetical protein
MEVLAAEVFGMNLDPRRKAESHENELGTAWIHRMSRLDAA